MNGNDETQGEVGKRPPLNIRKRRDCCFALLFGGFWVGMLIVAIVGLATGDVRRLLFGIDYLGNACGTCEDGNSCGFSIYYPRPGLDAIFQGFNPFSELVSSQEKMQESEINYFGVCVNECPSPGEFVCTYAMQQELNTNYPNATERESFLRTCHKEMTLSSRGVSNGFGASTLTGECQRAMEACWFVAQEQVNVFFRCLPKKVVNRTESEKCYFPRYQDAAETIEMPPTVCPDQVEAVTIPTSCDDANCFARTGSVCIRNDRCTYVMKEETVFSVENNYFSVTNLLIGEIVSWTETLSRSVADIEQAWWTILLVGGLGGFLLGFLWICILEYTVGVFVWLMILVSIVALVGAALLCFAKSGRMTSEITWVSTRLNNTGLVNAFSSSSGTEALWYMLGIAVSIACCVYVLILIVMRRKIKLAIRILEEASNAIEKIASILLMPFISGLLMLVVGVYAVGIFGYLYTSGYKSQQNLTLNDVPSSVLDELTGVASFAGGSRILLPPQYVSDLPFNDDEFGRNLALDFSNVNVTKALDVTLFSIVGNAGMVLMVLYHIFGCIWTLHVVSGVSTLSISRSVSQWYWTREKSELPFVSIFSNFAATLRWNFGTVCFGALLIAIMQFLRLIVYYVAKYMRKLEDKNSIARIIIRVLQCCLFFFEKILKYVTGNAYVMVGMFGCGYCKGAKLAVTYIISNMGRVGAVEFITKLISLLSILVICSACVMIEYLWLENDSRFQFGGTREVTSPVFPMIIVGILSFCIANSFMQVYDITVDTILLCFCVDVDYNKETKQYYMGRGLKKFFSKKNRSGKRSNKKDSSKPVASTAVVPT